MTGGITPRNGPARSRLTVACLLVVLSVGCGGGSQEVGVVTGRVLIDGEPAASGAVSFRPVDGLSPTAGGAIIDGRYRVEAPVGAAKVCIRAPTEVGQRKRYNTPDSPMIPVVEESLPRRYNDATELRIDVTPGVLEHDFDLSTE